ncbi:Rieske 2Fe-2S domain-containing protein [Thalassospira sp. MCCC 1A01428]|uniref:Rieske (2Fe-2S) protein n=1 Tax=Thalassospira sp. MCCC 1A01428 TaxID=1470575 RepID=UPI000A1EC6A9|nr:Rieske 2Fe-2S domain-containing protein [Thalassospira sp. MCCC 1A01428]
MSSSVQPGKQPATTPSQNPSFDPTSTGLVSSDVAKHATSDGDWQAATTLADLSQNGRKLVRINGRQVAIFQTENGLYACNNRCPHEGFPLMEGTMAQGCVLTCNWHNWKFDLESGDTLVGGDKLRRYPVRVTDDGVVELDMTDPPQNQQRAEILANLDVALHEHDYDRLCREMARLEQIGVDPLAAIKTAFSLRMDRFEYGTTHAMPGAADWLAYRDELTDDTERLASLAETIGHIAWDSSYRPVYPFTSDVADWSEPEFSRAVEAEDENTAVALVRGAMAAGLTWDNLRPAFARCAMRHYAGFGHSVIYVSKVAPLLAVLGADALESLLLPLTRHLCTVTREDLIPEFRAFHVVRKDWDSLVGSDPVTKDDFLGLPVSRVLARVRRSAGDVQGCYHALLGAAAWQVRHFDQSVMYRTNMPIGTNVNWLDVTHALTTAQAVRELATEMPELWGDGLLQIGCFIGRNVKYINTDPDQPDYAASAGIDGHQDGETILQGLLRDRVLNHGCSDYIEPVHRLKTIMMARAELAAFPDAPWRQDLLVAVHRYVNGEFPRRRAVRVAYQSQSFVGRE